MPKKSGIYSKLPVAPSKRIAETNPVGKPPLGNATPPIVPQRPATLHGLGIPSRPFGHPNVKGAHGFGHVARHRSGHLRNSGVPTAHQVGKK